ncbi:MAG: transporter permease [Eubacterium sp.]|nr:transporter permease [Eubacterium sp.]
MKTFSTLFKTEVKLSIRHLDAILFGVLFPVGIALLLGAIYGSKPAFEGAGYTMLQQSFGAFATIGICATGLMGLPLVLADYRHKKILKHYKVTPVSPSTLLVIQVLISFMLAVISATCTAIVSIAIFGYSMPGSIIKFILSFLLLTVTIYSIGMLVASLAPNIKIANLACTLLYFPMLFLSGATVPYEIMPGALQSVSDIFPMSQGIKLLKAASLGLPVGDMFIQIVIMAVISIICIALSIKFFKWE